MNAELPKSLKTRRSPQAMVYSLTKGCNAVLSNLGSSLRASREAAIHDVAPLGKGLPFPARRALWLTASRLAASINPVLTEY